MPNETPTLLELLNFTTILVLSTAFHEYAHAWSADRFGDDTPRRAGRLSLNPFVHLDPVMSLLVPVALFYTTGWFVAMASTPVNTANMRRPRLHGALCSLAGPLANVIFTVVTLLLLSVFLFAVGGLHADSPILHEKVLMVLLMAVQMNLFLFVFNMLPVPPLDGSHVLSALLPLKVAYYYESLRRYTFFFFAILMFSGAGSRVISPVLRFMEDFVLLIVHFVNGLAGG